MSENKRNKHLTPESRGIIDSMLSNGKPIKAIVEAVKVAIPDSKISYDNVYNYKKRLAKRVKVSSEKVVDLDATEPATESPDPFEIDGDEDHYEEGPQSAEAPKDNNPY